MAKCCLVHRSSAKRGRIQERRVQLVLWLGTDIFRHERVLEARGEASTTTPAEARRLDLVDDPLPALSRVEFSVDLKFYTTICSLPALPRLSEAEGTLLWPRRFTSQGPPRGHLVLIETSSHRCPAFESEAHENCQPDKGGTSSSCKETRNFAQTRCLLVSRDGVLPFGQSCPSCASRQSS
jgi:hypothetical protein